VKPRCNADAWRILPLKPTPSRRFHPRRLPGRLARQARILRANKEDPRRVALETVERDFCRNPPLGNEQDGATRPRHYIVKRNVTSVNSRSLALLALLADAKKLIRAARVAALRIFRRPASGVPIGRNLKNLTGHRRNNPCSLTFHARPRKNLISIHAVEFK